jgi:propanol-preferring alcohol dehydrogenase
MRAMVLLAIRSPLVMQERPEPVPGPGHVRVRVGANAVCRTDLHVVDGELEHPKLPLVLGHQVVGTVDAVGEGVADLVCGDRVGIPWLGGTCGACRYCTSGRENLCGDARFTGHHVDGGYAEATVADARFCFRISSELTDDQMAPLLCAGLIGYRALKMAGSASKIGFYGFGAAAHILVQVARHQGRRIFAFTRPGDVAAQDFARSCGAVWAGGSDQLPPEELEAAILFAPVGALVPAALRAVERGGVVVAAGIHMSDIPAFPYALLWGERAVRSVANLTRQDGEEFLHLAPRVPVRAHVQSYALADANRALDDVRNGRVSGSAVLVP